MHLDFLRRFIQVLSSARRAFVDRSNYEHGTVVDIVCEPCVSSGLRTLGPADRPTKFSSNRPPVIVTKSTWAERPTGRPADLPAGRPANRLTHQSADGPTGWSTDVCEAPCASSRWYRPTDRPANRPIAWPADCPIRPTKVPKAPCVSCHSTDRQTDRFDFPADGPTEPIDICKAHCISDHSISRPTNGWPIGRLASELKNLSRGLGQTNFCLQTTDVSMRSGSTYFVFKSKCY